MSKASIQELLARPISFNPAIARAVGGVNPGLFMCQLIYWSDKGSDAEWIYKTQAEWEEETCLSRREQETARRKLVDAGFVYEKRAGDHGIMHYKVNWAVLEEALTNGATSQTPMAESAKRQWRNPPNTNGGKRQSLNTETTTETTTQDLQEETRNLINEWNDGYFNLTGKSRGASTQDAVYLQTMMREYGLGAADVRHYIQRLFTEWKSASRDNKRFWPLRITALDGKMLSRLDTEIAADEEETAELMRQGGYEYTPAHLRKQA